MRVLVDLLFMTGRRGGMESYVRRMYGAMPSSDVDWVGLASRQLARDGADWFPGTLIDSGVDARSRARWALGELRIPPRLAQRLGADVVHCPANIGPRRSPVPQVTTVHDLLPFTHPELLPGRYAPVLRSLVRGAVRASARVVTPSAASAHDLRALLGVGEGRIDVIPLGADPVDSATDRAADALLAVGNALPHKNLAILVDALDRIPAQRRPSLVVVGGGTDAVLGDLIEARGLGRWIDARGWVSDEELDRLYGTATALVLPTRMEGFGLPVLEAMARGCPVIASDLAVLREVGGDSAQWVDTTDAGALARAIEELVQDPVRRARMAESGRRTAAAFSWTATATATLASLRRASAASSG